MDGFLFNLLLFLTLFFVVTQAAMLIVFIRSQQKHETDHLGDPALWGEAKKKSDFVVQDALSKANQIVSQAEKKGVDLLAEEEKKGITLAQDYKAHFEKVEAFLKEQFDKSAQSAGQEYTDFIKAIEAKVNEHIGETQKNLSTASSGLVDSMQKSLEKMSADVDKRVKDQVEHALDEARSEISEYKKRRMKVVDERIIDMLEDVIKVTLEKKLSLVEQSELVYKALDEAKKENAFS